jgi:hypothetical protein
MSESGHSEKASSLLPEPFDGRQQIASLRESGAQQLDPLRLHYLEVLCEHALAHQGLVKSILENKLARAVEDFKHRLEQVQTPSPAGDSTAQVAPPVPPRESLGDLVRSMAQHAPEKSDAGLQGMVPAGPELKSVRMFRNTWSKLSADKQLNKALDQAPKNAGPINSHMLVLRSLALMREISPDYLNRFISYADTLVCLEQAEKAKYAMPKNSAQAQSAKKPKARRPRVL